MTEAILTPSMGGKPAPNPSRLSLTDAMQQAETAASDLRNIADLLGALASSAGILQPNSLFVVGDAAEKASAEIDEAWKVLFPILCAARSAKVPA